LLVQKNLIRITAVVNPERVGFPVKADIYVQVESMHLLETAHRLAELELTSWVACAIRDSHFSIQVCVQDVRELYRFVSEVIHKVPGITRTATSLVSQVLKDSYDWHIPKSKAEDVPIKGRELA
jgi:DNA-binding Lrp family transcriptional regulator